MIVSAVEDLEDALLAAAVDGLADCDLAPVRKAFVYHSPFTPGPEPCCADDTNGDGFLAAWWAPIYPATVAGRPAPNMPGEPTFPGVDVTLRLWRCFPTLTRDGFDLTKAETASRSLTQDAECIWLALRAAACDPTILEQVHCQRVFVANAEPIRPQAGCAGIAFKVSALWQAVVSP